MTKNELIRKIEKGTDIMFTVDEKGYTICDTEQFENGKDIAPWGSSEAIAFQDAKSLVNKFLIDGIPLGDIARKVIITDYTLNGT